MVIYCGECVLEVMIYLRIKKYYLKHGVKNCTFDSPLVHMSSVYFLKNHIKQPKEEVKRNLRVS